jgi:hypothetical protein
MAIAAVFAGLTVLLLVMTLAFRQPLLLFVAIPFGITTYFMWYQASGRLQAAFESGRRRVGPDGRGAGPGPGGFGAGARRQAREDRRRARARAGGGPGSRTGRSAGGERGFGVQPDDRPSRAEALRTLGLDGDATDDEVRHAYRERVKEVHPDRGGDEESFKRVTRAYERLTD